MRGISDRRSQIANSPFEICNLLFRVTGRLIIQDTPPCWPEVVKEIAGAFVRLGEKATDVLRRLKERPGFPRCHQSMSNPG
jgi:hypothetical protein